MGEIRLQVRSRKGLLLRLPKLAWNHYTIFRRVYSRRYSFLSSLRLIKSTLVWRFNTYGKGG